MARKKSAKKTGKEATLQIPITTFAVPSPRLGHIEPDSGYGPLPNLGVEIHQRIQAERLRQPGNYIAEKWVSHTFSFKPYSVLVSGRLDGLRLGTPDIVEEIKSTYNPEGLAERLKADPFHPYCLQLRTYGYLHFLNRGIEPELKLIVVCARRGTIEEISVPLETPSYEDWLYRRLEEINETEKKFAKIREHRRQASTKLNFPFPEPRPGQHELIQFIDSNLKKNSRQLLQAPTGLGKTVGVLYPALKESLNRGQKTIYVTAKNSQHTVAEDAVQRLNKAGADLHSVTIHAKGKMCLKDVVHCSPDYCEFAKDYYGKLHHQKIREKLGKTKTLGEREFKDLGEKFMVCPFELQMEALPKADVVVCDYNYVFSPQCRSGRILENGFTATTPPNLVVDEAHNLPARATDYFSATLDLGEIQSEMEKATYVEEDIWRKTKELFARLERDTLAIQDNQARGAHLVPPGALRVLPWMEESDRLLRDYLASHSDLRPEDPILKICGLVKNFAELAVTEGDAFSLTRTPKPSGDRLRITCFDAADFLKERYSEFAHVICFSATLKPFDYYQRTLGLDKDSTITAEFESPFPEGNRKILIIPQVSTRFRDREKNYGKVKEVIEKVLTLKPGNYFVFFPSFDFLYRVFELVDLPQFRKLAQKRDMTRSQIAEVLRLLETEDQPTVMFAVQGGVFAEGVDYPGRMLIGAMIVGPALPNFDFERECMAKYFSSQGGPGFDYAYTYPAMTRVVQSAGRVIRSAEDRGLIVLMDNRFLQESYLKAMPSDWLRRGLDSLRSDKILADIEEFWGPGET